MWFLYLVGLVGLRCWNHRGRQQIWQGTAPSSCHSATMPCHGSSWPMAHAGSPDAIALHWCEWVWRKRFGRDPGVTWWHKATMPQLRCGTSSAFAKSHSWGWSMHCLSGYLYHQAVAGHALLISQGRPLTLIRTLSIEFSWARPFTPNCLPFNPTCSQSTLSQRVTQTIHCRYKTVWTQFQNTTGGPSWQDPQAGC